MRIASVAKLHLSYGQTLNSKIVLEYTSKLNIVTSKIYHGFHTPGPPGCVTWPTATFVNCVYLVISLKAYGAQRVLGRLSLPDSVTSALEGGRLSAIRTGRLYPQKYPGTHLRSWVDPGHIELDATAKIPSDTTGDRSRELPTSVLTTTPPQALNCVYSTTITP
jgi:hypothetical protein